MDAPKKFGVGALRVARLDTFASDVHVAGHESLVVLLLELDFDFPHLHCNLLTQLKLHGGLVGLLLLFDLLDLGFHHFYLVVVFSLDLRANIAFHHIVVVLQSLELTGRNVKLIDHLVALRHQLCICQCFDILKKLFAFLAVK